MKYQADGYNWLVRLDKGEKLVESLTRLMAEQHIPSSWLSIIGGASSVTLGYYDLPNQTYQWKTIDQVLEIASLSGNLAWQDGQAVFHIHGTFTDADFQTIGGHVKELTVGGTCEVFVHRWYKKPWQRALDSDTGLNLLEL